MKIFLFDKQGVKVGEGDYSNPKHIPKEYSYQEVDKLTEIEEVPDPIIQKLDMILEKVTVIEMPVMKAISNPEIREVEVPIYVPVEPVKKTLIDKAKDILGINKDKE